MCVCVGVYGYSRVLESIVARDVKKRCACLVRAHAFSQPRGNGRAGVWVGGGGRAVRGCEGGGGARAAAAAGLLRPGKGREDDRLPACSSSSSSSSSSFSPARRASVGDLIVGISITTAIDLWYRIVSLRVG